MLIPLVSSINEPALIESCISNIHYRTYQTRQKIRKDGEISFALLDMASLKVTEIDFKRKLMRSQTLIYEINADRTIKKGGRNEVTFQQAREFNPATDMFEGGIDISKHSLRESEIKRFVDRVLAFAERKLVELGTRGRPAVLSERLFVASWFQMYTSHGVIPEQERPAINRTQTEALDEEEGYTVPLIDPGKLLPPGPSRVIEALAQSPLKLLRLALRDGKERIAIITKGRPFIICGSAESPAARELAELILRAPWFTALADYLGMGLFHCSVGTISGEQYSEASYHALCLDNRPLCVFNLPQEHQSKAGILCLDDGLGALLVKGWVPTGIRIEDIALMDALCAASPNLVNSLDRLERAVFSISCSPLIQELMERPIEVARKAVAQAMGHC